MCALIIGAAIVSWSIISSRLSIFLWIVMHVAIYVLQIIAKIVRAEKSFIILLMTKYEIIFHAIDAVYTQAVFMQIPSGNQVHSIEF